MTEEKLPPVYTIAFDDSKPKITGEALNGDPFKVEADLEFDQYGTYFDTDGRVIQSTMEATGYPVKTEHLPTKVRFGGRKRERDFDMNASMMVASDKFRDVLEGLEPGVHQFVPFEATWKDGSSAGEWFWFFPGHRIDGMDREATTHPYRDDIQRYSHKNGNRYVANLTQIGDVHVYMDAAAPWQFPRVFAVFKKAMDEAGAKGIVYYEMPTVR